MRRQRAGCLSADDPPLRVESRVHGGGSAPGLRHAALELRRADLDDPLASYLLLTGDSRLTVRELMAVRHPGIRVAVLSACESALVGDAVPDEVIGLPAGLLEAGAASAAATLWAVPDVSSAMLVARFYEIWRGDGRSPAQALRGAQQWLRDSSNAEKLEAFPEILAPVAERLPVPSHRLWERARGHRAPHHWAAWTLTGS